MSNSERKRRMVFGSYGISHNERATFAERWRLTGPGLDEAFGNYDEAAFWAKRFERVRQITRDFWSTDAAQEAEARTTKHYRAKIEQLEADALKSRDQLLNAARAEHLAELEKVKAEAAKAAIEHAKSLEALKLEWAQEAARLAKLVKEQTLIAEIYLKHLRNSDKVRHEIGEEYRSVFGLLNEHLIGAEQEAERSACAERVMVYRGMRFTIETQRQSVAMRFGHLYEGSGEREAQKEVSARVPARVQAGGAL